MTGISVAALLAVSLVACAPGETERDDPPPTPSKSETAEPVPEPLVIPECDALVPPVAVEDGFQVVAGEQGARLEQLVRESLDPIAQETIAGALQYLPCSSGVPNSDILVSFFAAELTEEARDRLMTALRDGDYEESVRDAERTGSITVFTRTAAGPPERRTWYGFSGNAWVMTTGYWDEQTGEHIFEQLRAANPSLGEE